MATRSIYIPHSEDREATLTDTGQVLSTPRNSFNSSNIATPTCTSGELHKISQFRLALNEFWA